MGSNREELLPFALRALLSRRSVKPGTRKLAYLFTGQGSQRLGMGKGCYDSDPLFAEAFDRACEQLDLHLDKPLQEIVFAKGKKAQALLDDTTYAQPTLFAIEVALFEALSKRGLKPDLLTGHSIGEIAAAHVAGVLDLPDAAKLVAARGRLMGALPKGGAMAAIEASEEEVEELDRRQGGRACDRRDQRTNLNRHLRNSGGGRGGSLPLGGARPPDQSARRLPRLPLAPDGADARGVREVAGSLDFNEPKLPIVSNLTASRSAPSQPQTRLLIRHVREPVRFADGVATLQKQGASTYLELDPTRCSWRWHASAWARRPKKGRFPPHPARGTEGGGSDLNRDRPRSCLGSKARLGSLFKGTGAKRVPLPTYPFQKTRYWLSAAMELGTSAPPTSATPTTPCSPRRSKPERKE